MSENFIVDTPEAISLSYDVAGIGSRFMAALVDSLLIVIAQVLVVLATAAATRLLSAVEVGEALTSWAGALLGLLAFALLWGYYVFFEMIWNGQSPGKRWVGLRVVKENGSPISLVDSAIRNLVRLVDFLPLYYGVGVVVMFLNARARRLGDLAAGTVVIRERKEITLEGLTAAAGASPGPVPAEPLPGVEALTAEDYDLITRFLQRRHELGNRGELATRLAAGLTARMGLPPQELPAAAAEAYLVQLATAYRAQHRREP